MNHAEFSSRGGKARAKKLTASARKRIASNAAKTRWKKKRSARLSNVCMSRRRRKTKTMNSTLTSELPSVPPVGSMQLLGRVLVACEFSGIVRDAFAARGWDAWSCDILPTESKGQHFQGDVRDILHKSWDIIIAHPPCTHLCSSGARYFAAKKADGRQQQGVDFFMAMVNAPVARLAIENPVGIMSGIYRKPDQIIQPWMFGHPDSKATCLWLRGLPKLTPTKVLHPEWGKPDKNGKRTSLSHNAPRIRWNNQTASGQNKLGPSLKHPELRAKLRSITYTGIAEAMADQWTHATRPNAPHEPRRE
jgi:hypothetical protein